MSSRYHFADIAADNLHSTRWLKAAPLSNAKKRLTDPHHFADMRVAKRDPIRGEHLKGSSTAVAT